MREPLNRYTPPMITQYQLAYANEAYILTQARDHLRFKRTKLDPARAQIYKMVVDDLEEDIAELLGKIGETYTPSLEGGVSVNTTP